MSTKNNKSKKAKAPEQIVMVCYHGLASGHENAGTVEHIAPLVTLINGEIPLMLRPGLTPQPAAQWSTYKDHPPILKAIRDGSIDDPDATEARVSTRDQGALVVLINRTQDPGGLTWLLDRENARDIPRKRVLDAIAKRAPRLREAPPLNRMPLTSRAAPPAASKPSPTATAQA